jgi:hypothetical protein
MTDTPIGTRRTTWPAAAPLQQAADRLREVAPDITGPPRGLADAVADWLDQAANQLAWLAPYRDHEGGYGMWEAASRVAAAVNGTAVPSGASVQEVRNCYTDEAARKSLTHSPEQPCDRTQAHPGHKYLRHRAAWYCPGTPTT